MIWSDKGSEFISKHFKDYLSNKGINLSHTEIEEKSSVVERWNKTINIKCENCLVRITILFTGINLKSWLIILRTQDILV